MIALLATLRAAADIVAALAALADGTDAALERIVARRRVHL